MSGSMEQLNIFSVIDEEPNTETNKLKMKASIDSFFPSAKKQSVAWVERTYANFIEQYVKEGFTVSEICRFLIEKHNASNEMFESGKPKIYPYIMIYLDTLVEDGLCTAKQRNASEGIYEWIETKIE